MHPTAALAGGARVTVVTSHLKSVLLVDDDSTNNYLNKLLLIRLAVAENGREALATLKRVCEAPIPSCPALLRLDINVP